MTTPAPRPEPVKPGSPSRPQDRHAAASRTTRIIATAALVLAVVGVGLAAWAVLTPPQQDACQEQAWDVTPATGDLPAGWVTSATQYDLQRKSLSFAGLPPEDEFSSQAVVYATVTCFSDGAEDAVNRSRTAAEEAGQSVIERDDLGDQAFSAADDTGAIFLQLRHGPVVVYLAASGDASATEVDEIASAFDKAMGGDGGLIAVATPAPSDDLGAGESLDPGEELPAESPAAPELVAALPTQVGAVQLDADSASGSTILGEDQGSRAILAALRAAGREPDDLKVAQAFDAAGESDLSILAVTMSGMPVDQTQQIVLESWLAATGAGVTTEDADLGGETWRRIDYGDGGTIDYVRSIGDIVFVITTADPALADQAAAAIP